MRFIDAPETSRYAALGSILALGVAAFEPSSSIGLDAVVRAVFWLLHLLVGLLLCLAVKHLLQRSNLRTHWTITTGLAGFLATLPYAPLAWWLEELFPIVDLDDEAAPKSFWSAVMLEWSELVAPFMLTWFAIEWLMRAFRSTRTEAAPTQKQSSISPKPAPALPTRAAAALTDQLPAALGTDIVAVSAEEHYLRVRTPAGEALIRCSFKQAVNNYLNELNGLQIHRSHWVNLDTVRQLLSGNRQWSCVMADGSHLPISRRKRPEVVRALAAVQIYPSKPLRRIPVKHDESCVRTEQLVAAGVKRR